MSGHYLDSGRTTTRTGTINGTVVPQTTSTATLEAVRGVAASFLWACAAPACPVLGYAHASMAYINAWSLCKGLHIVQTQTGYKTMLLVCCLMLIHDVCP